MPKQKKVMLQASQKMDAPITWAMLELQALEALQDLMKRAPRAAQLVLCLIRHMRPGSGGVVLASRETMRELIGSSMPTVERALRVLIQEGWVQRIKVGGAHALAINSRVAWVGPRGDLPHAVFEATVIASRTEQDAAALNPPPAKTLPIVQAGEQVATHGEGLPPPAQHLLTGVDPVVGQTQGNLTDAERLELLGQQRLVE